MRKVPIAVALLSSLLSLGVTPGFTQQSPSREEISKGAAVYAKKCQRCESLRERGGTGATWKELITRERQRDPQWLTNEEARVLLIYLENPPK